LGENEFHGSGQTRNISSGGVLFEVAEWQPWQPFSGCIELMVSWPCLLNGVRALKLMMKGRVGRSDGRASPEDPSSMNSVPPACTAVQRRKI
jgi:hypothetical protein